MSYGSWAIIHNPDQKEEVLAVPGLGEGDNFPIWQGMVEDFLRYWQDPVVVNWCGHYIDVREEARTCDD